MVKKVKKKTAKVKEIGNDGDDVNDAVASSKTKNKAVIEIAERKAFSVVEKLASEANVQNKGEKKEKKVVIDEDAEATKKKRKKIKPKTRADSEESEAEEKGKIKPKTRADSEDSKAGETQSHKKRKIDEAIVDKMKPVADQKRLKKEDGSGTPSKILGGKAYREAHKIEVPEKCPEPVETFDATGELFGKKLCKALLAQGYKAPTPIQAQAWPLALKGIDVVAVAKTGSGKTCGFLLPILVRISQRGVNKRPRFREPIYPTALVLAPTRELIQQIKGEADKFAPVVDARAICYFGGVDRIPQMKETSSGADIVLATPGRLMDFAEPKDGKPAIVSLSKVNYLVLDEADRMLDMGFEPDIRHISGECLPSGKPEEGGGAPSPLGGTRRQTLFFTATWPKAVQKTARTLTSSDAIDVRIGQDGDELSANPSVAQKVFMVRESEKMNKLHEIIKKELGKGETCLVFAQQKSTCDDVAYAIRQERSGYGFSPWCKSIHSGKAQEMRDETLSEFRKITAGKGAPDKRGIMVATDVASRGLDIPGVAMVILYDFGRARLGEDTSVESYVHRIGRTGRAGRNGKAFIFFTDLDNGACKLCDILKRAGQPVPEALQKMGEREGWEVEKLEERRARAKGKGGKDGKSGKGKGKGKDGKKGGKGKGKDKGKGKGGKRGDSIFD